MYLLIVKDGHLARYIGPYLTTKNASEDLQRVLATCSNRASWQIHALEPPSAKSFKTKTTFINEEPLARKAS